MVACGVRAVGENRIVHQKRERGERPIKACGGTVVPEFFGKDQVDVLLGDGVDTRVLQDRRGIVENKAGPKGVRVGDEGERHNRQDPDAVLAGEAGWDDRRDLAIALRYFRWE